MGIFDDIKKAIWGAPKDAATAEADKPVMAGAAGGTTTAGAAVPTPAAAPKPAAAAAAATPTVDVAAMLNAAVKAKGQKLDWHHSIVDLMKALDLDSSLTARKQLAAELGYAGDTGGGVIGRWIDLGYDETEFVPWSGYVDVYYLVPMPENINYRLPQELP